MSGASTWKQFLGYPEDDRALLLIGELAEVADIDARDEAGNACNLSESIEITISSRRMLRDEVKRNQELERKRRYEDKNPTRKRLSSDGNPTASGSNPTPIYQKSEVRVREDKSKTAARGFDEFWQAYPKKKARGDAEKAWRGVRPDEALVGVILRAVEFQVRSEEWVKDGGKFIPHPGTWLRAKRWQDEADSAPEVARRVPLVVSPSNGHGDKPLSREEQQVRLRTLVGGIGE